MAHLIDKDAVVAEIERRITEGEKVAKEITSSAVIGLIHAYKNTLSIISTLEVKEVDLDALGVLAEHLIACDAHSVTPKYTYKELDLLEEWAKNNKAQKGEEV